MASSANENTILNRKRSIVTALCKYKNLDPELFLGDLGNDVKSLSIDIVKASLENNGELTRWITFAENFPVDSEACFKSLLELNEDLTQKSVLLGGGLKPSEADIIVFSAVHSSVIGLPDLAKVNVPHLMRWMDYIQCVQNFGGLFERIVLEKAPFDPPLLNSVTKVEPEKTTKKADQSAKSSEAESSSKKNADAKEVTGISKVATEKNKFPEKVAGEKDMELSVSLLKIQVGLIRKALKHPSADSLLVEEIDVGEGKCRQVVSGLAKFCSPDELKNRLVVLITNVKPGKLRDVISEGLVLCASNEDHSKVEPLIVPEGAKIGECVLFSGHEGKPEDVLNPKKKQLEKITPHLSTDEKGVATFKGVPFMTSAGPCMSSIPNASVK